MACTGTMDRAAADPVLGLPRRAMLFYLIDLGSRLQPTNPTNNQTLLDDHGLIASICRRGNCLDNAPTERCSHSLKVEANRDEPLMTHRQLRHHLFQYIEVDNNRSRRQSIIGLFNSEDFEAKQTASSRVHCCCARSVRRLPPVADLVAPLQENISRWRWRWRCSCSVSSMPGSGCAFARAPACSTRTVWRSSGP